jgi:hypothetical protein
MTASTDAIACSATCRRAESNDAMSVSTLSARRYTARLASRCVLARPTRRNCCKCCAAFATLRPNRSASASTPRGRRASCAINFTRFSRPTALASAANAERTRLAAVRLDVASASDD